MNLPFLIRYNHDTYISWCFTSKYIWQTRCEYGVANVSYANLWVHVVGVNIIYLAFPIDIILNNHYKLLVEVLY